MSKCKAVMDGDKITSIQVKTKQNTTDVRKNVTVEQRSVKEEGGKNRARLEKHR